MTRRRRHERRATSSGHHSRKADAGSASLAAEQAGSACSRLRRAATHRNRANLGGRGKGGRAVTELQLILVVPYDAPSADECPQPILMQHYRADRCEFRTT